MQRIVILHGQLTHSPWVSRFGYIVYILLQDHAHNTHHAMKTFELTAKKSKKIPNIQNFMLNNI